MDKITIFGPPGSGKTTCLLDILERELAKVCSREIAFVSFTRKGVSEGTARAKKRFTLDKDDLPFFKTLHSLCFAALGCNREDTIGKAEFRKFSRVLGIPFTGHYTEAFNSPNDAYLHAISMEHHNPEIAYEMSKHLNRKKYVYIKANYAHMKKQLGVRDFDDMLEQYLAKGKPLNVKVAIIDEAQDLTPLQWRVACKMFANAERIYVAGDDDQTVFEWAGADVNQFLDFSDNFTVLDRSYRLPGVILKAAQRVTRDISRRKEKTFKDNGHEGVFDTAESVRHIGFNGGELVLARTNHLLRRIALDLEADGIFYTLKGVPSIRANTRKAIVAYNKFAKGELKDYEILKYASYFTDINAQRPWMDVINLTADQIAYFEKMFLTDAYYKTPVLLETFHSSKGSEADRVIISPTMTALVHANYDAHLDAELRCLYVGMTRAKRRLTVLGRDQSQVHAYPEKYFA